MERERVIEDRNTDIVVDDTTGGTERTAPTARTRPEGTYEAERTYGAETTASETRPVRNRIGGAPVWSGFAVGFASWILFEAILLASDLTGLAFAQPAAVQPTEWWWTFAAAIVAVAIGGLVAGATSVWKGSLDGALQGLTVWGIVTIALLLFSAFGAGVSFGAFGQLLSTGRAAAAGATVPPEGIEAARDAAGYVALTLAATAVAAAAGGAAGAKAWPRGSDRSVARR